jgi:hypothetical protein
VTDVEVVLTDRPSELRGRVTDDSGSGVAGASILVFSTEASRWYLASLHVRRTITQDDGTFAVAGMPSGTYYVAVASSGNAELPDQIRVRGGDIGWQDPVALEALTSSAAVVTLVESTRTSVLLRR